MSGSQICDERWTHGVNVIGTYMSLFQGRYMDGKQASGLVAQTKHNWEHSLKMGYYM